MTAIEQYHAPTSLTMPNEREFAGLWKMSEAFARSGMLLPNLKDKPEAVMAAALTCWAADMPVTLTTLNQFYEVNGKIQAGTQFHVALAAQRGVEVWFDDNCDDRHAIAYGRRASSDRVHKYEFTWEMAEKAGLTKKDNWKHPEIMLRYRAASRLIRTSFPDCYMGLPPNVVDEGLAPVDRSTLEQSAIDVGVVPEPEDWPPAPVPTDWVTKFIDGCRTKLWPDEEPAIVAEKGAALVAYATDGRTADPAEVHAETEKARVEDAFRRVQNGDLTLTTRWVVTDEDVAEAELVEQEPEAPAVEGEMFAADDPERPYTED